MIRWTFIAGLLSSLLIAQFAQSSAVAAEGSKDSVDQAKTYFEAGKQAYEANRYSIATTAFEEAYRLAPRPQVLFSMAQAYRQQYFIDREPSRLKRAVDLFLDYVRQVPKGGRREHAMQHLSDLEPMLKRVEDEQRRLGASMTAPARAEAKTQLMITSRTPNAQATFGDDDLSELPLIRDVKPGKHKVRVVADGFVTEDVEGVAVEGRLVVSEVNLREQPAIIALAAPPGSEVALDGRFVGTAPLQAPLAVPAGRHFVVVTERGSYAYARDLSLARGQSMSIEAELETTTQRTVSYYFLGAAGAMFIAGGITGAIALAAEGTAKDIDVQRTSRAGLQAKDLQNYQRAVDRRDRFAPVTYGLAGAGLAVGVTGALLYFIDSPRIEALDFGTGVTPMVGTQSIGAAWFGSF